MKKHFILLCLIFLAHSMFAQFHWEHTGGPPGYAGGEMFYNKNFAFLYDQYQLYRTSDGQSWEAINSASAAIINVTDDRISIYTEQKKGISQPKEIEFLISDDYGDTWYSAPVPQDAYYNINQTMICSHGIYFKAGEKLYRSQTSGQSWKQVSYDGILFNSLFSSNDRIFGRNEDRIYEFNPQSGKWVYSWKMPPTPDLGTIFIKGSNIIIRTGNRFYSSINKGANWVTYHTSTNAIGNLIEKDNKIYYLTDKLMRYTEDGGFTWNSFSLNIQYQNVCLIKDKFLLYSSAIGYVLFDETSNTYLPANQGLASSEVLWLGAGHNQIWAHLTDGSIHKYDVHSGTWSPSGLPYSNEIFLDMLISSSGNLLYNKGVPKNILISTNQGTSWDTLTVPFNRHNDVNTYFWIGDYIYVEGNSGAYISNDFGLTWNALSKRLRSGVIFRDQLWASEDSGRLVVSDDNGLNWTDTDTEWENITTLLVAEDRIFVVNSAGHVTLHSSEDGIKWEYSGAGISIPGASSGRLGEKKVWKQNGIYYFQQFNSRLYYSTDNCSSWELVLPTDTNSDIAILNDTIYWGMTKGGGVIKSKMPQLVRPFVKGSVFYDLNGDGIKDPNETYMNDVQMMVSTDTDPQKHYFTLSNQEGQFEIRPTSEFNDKLWPNLFSAYVESIEPAFYYIHDSIDNYDFAVRLIPDVTDVSINGKFNIQPGAGMEISTNIFYQNKGTIPMSGTVGLKLDPEFTFIQSVPQPSEIIGTDSLIWHFEDLPVFGKNQILVQGIVSPNVSDGSLITMEGNILPSGADIAMSDNAFVIQEPITSTYIPNQKTVFPEEGMTVDEMLEGKELEYTIRFQNPYDHIVNSVQITDALANNLDYETIRISGSSHEITKWELLPSGVLRVFFDNMNLAPYSTEDQRDLGFLNFAIKIRKDNNHSFNFTNTAIIIFDDINSIRTNAVSTKMLEDVISSTQDIGSESLSKLSIIPNPASQNCYLSTNGRMKGSGIVRIFNANGRVLSMQHVRDFSMNIQLQIDQLSNGFYLITAEGEDGIMHGKLIIQN